MLSRRMPLAALAAVTAALAVAVPATSANAATATTTATTVDPTVCQLVNITAGPFGPGMFLGGASLRNTLLHAGASVGCPAPPPPPSLLPGGFFGR
jgi:hypothetical protein